MTTLPRVRVFRGCHEGKEGRVVYYNPPAGRELTIEVDSLASNATIEVKKTTAELAPTVVAMAV